MRPSVERELVLLERRIRAELGREFDERLLELTRYVDERLEAIEQRVDTVHSKALRALTNQLGKGAR